MSANENPQDGSATLQPQRRTTVVVVANQKGGTTKTTTTVHLAAGLARRGWSVAVMDCDGQCNATRYLATPENARVMLSEAPYCNMMDLCAVKDVSWEDTIGPSTIPNLEIIGATKWMQASDERLMTLINNPINWPKFPVGPVDAHDPDNPSQTRKVIPAERMLQSRLSEIPHGRWDFMVIDTPPSMNLATRNALLISDWVIIPLDLAPMSLDGTAFMLESLDELGARNNKKIRLLGAVVTLVEKHILSVKMMQDLKNRFGDKLFESRVRKATSIKEASGFQLSAYDYAPKQMATYDYDQVVEEFIRRLRAEGVDIPEPRFSPLPPMINPQLIPKRTLKRKTRSRSKLKSVPDPGLKASAILS
jgi:chromosome partitioning protein